MGQERENHPIFQDHSAEDTKHGCWWLLPNHSRNDNKDQSLHDYAIIIKQSMQASIDKIGNIRELTLKNAKKTNGIVSDEVGYNSPCAHFRAIASIHLM